MAWDRAELVEARWGKRDAAVREDQVVVVVVVVAVAFEDAERCPGLDGVSVDAPPQGVVPSDTDRHRSDKQKRKQTKEGPSCPLSHSSS